MESTLGEDNIVTWRLKDEIVERVDMAIASQRCGKYVPAATNKHATTEQLLEAVLSMW
jgi:hypothetical protein